MLATPPGVLWLVVVHAGVLPPMKPLSQACRICPRSRVGPTVRISFPPKIPTVVLRPEDTADVTAYIVGYVINADPTNSCGVS